MDSGLGSKGKKWWSGGRGSVVCEKGKGMGWKRWLLVRSIAPCYIKTWELLLRRVRTRGLRIVVELDRVWT